MELWLGIVIGAVLAIGAVALIGRRVVPGVDPTQLTFDQAVMHEVTELLARDRKIEAVALLRSTTPGLSVASAKAMVDRMDAAARRSAAGAPAAPGAPGAPEAAAESPAPVDPDSVPSADSLALEVELDVRSLKAQGNTIGAIKVVREHTGWGLKESKDFVDNL